MSSTCDKRGGPAPMALSGSVELEGACARLPGRVARSVERRTTYRPAGPSLLPSATVKLPRVALMVATQGRMRRATTTLTLALCLFGPGSCAVGLLLVDPTYGTAVKDETTGGNTVTPVMWRPGFTGRRVGSEVAVVGPIGQLVATTDRKFQIDGGYWFENPRVFVACGGLIQK